MDGRNNTIAGWVLFGCGAALALSIVGGMIYEGERPAKMGYPIEGVEAEGGDTAVAEVPIATLLPKADPAKGAEVFKKCAACHTDNQGGANGIGPNLYGIVGDEIAKGRGGFAFSDALAKVGGKWDFDKLNAWLTSPRKFAPGTKMTFAGLGNPQDRANVLVYLNAQGSNLPLPAAPAAAAAPAGPDAKTGGTAPGGASGKAGAGAAPGATSAINAVATDRRAPTADIGNTGTPASGAPSIDPNATKQGAKAK
jgi:cytochrome c